MFAFYCNDLCLNLSGEYIFSVKFMLEKNENKQKEPGDGPFKKTIETFSKVTTIVQVAV